MLGIPDATPRPRPTPRPSEAGLVLAVLDAEHLLGERARAREDGRREFAVE